jgi:hypothetical protein
LIARDPREFADAIARLHGETALAASLIEAGRRARRVRHDPGEMARRMVEAYRSDRSTAR